jgi:LysR family glycine cleavage system transcriptional activator
VRKAHSTKKPAPASAAPRYGRRLPPLNAVCAFEACVRLGSTVAAASELGVTHGAVSKQLSLLEGWLDIALFERGGVRLVPTAAGIRYAEVLGRALDLVDGATRNVGDTAGRAATVVRVSATASFAELWLLPRLSRFRELHPSIEVWVSQTKALVKVGAPGRCDLALRTGRGPWPGVRAEPLMSEELVPLCAPALASGLRRPADLAQATLLHDGDPRAAWPDWLAAAKLGRPAWGERGPRLAGSNLLLHAATLGHGVALVGRRLAAGHQQNGRLVQPFGPALPIGPAYWLVLAPRGTPTSLAARTFADWVRGEARRESELTAPVKRAPVARAIRRRQAPGTSRG